MAHCMHTDLFLAMNKRWDPSGMSPEVVLTERVCRFQAGGNQPADSQDAPHPALQVPGAPVPPAAANQARNANLMLFDGVC